MIEKGNNMIMKQVELRQDDGLTIISWIDKNHAVIGRRIDLNLGNGQRSPTMEICKVWQIERDS